MAKKHISVTNKRVLDAMENSKNASRLIEDAMIYYLDAIEHEYITKTEVQSLIVECLKGVAITGPISNKNYIHSIEQLSNDIAGILDL